MMAYSIYFNNVDAQKVKAFLDFVQSLDIVRKVEPLLQPLPAPLPSAEPSDLYLSKAEICALYPDEWVLLTDAQVEGVDVIGGRILLHNKDKRELALMAQQQQQALATMSKKLFFTGTPPKHRRVGLLRKVTV